LQSKKTTERERLPDRGLKASSPGTNGYREDQQSDKSTTPASCNDLASFQTSVDLQFAAWHLCQFGHPLE
jgi:hypothetical protein